MIYLDYSANTPADERVLARFCAVERRCPGNANSHHQAGLDAKAEIDHATQTIARLLRVQPAEIIYTSGASESNNFALKGLARLSRGAASAGDCRDPERSPSLPPACGRHPSRGQNSGLV